MERKEQQSLNEAVQGILGKTTQSDLDKLLTQLGTAIQDHRNVISSQVWRQTQKLHPSISHIPTFIKQTNIKLPYVGDKKSKGMKPLQRIGYKKNDLKGYDKRRKEDYIHSTNIMFDASGWEVKTFVPKGQQDMMIVYSNPFLKKKNTVVGISTFYKEIKNWVDKATKHTVDAIDKEFKKNGLKLGYIDDIDDIISKYKKAVGFTKTYRIGNWVMVDNEKMTQIDAVKKMNKKLKLKESTQFDRQSHIRLKEAIEDVVEGKRWKVGDRIIPNPKYNKGDDWAKKHGVVTKILSGGKIEVKLDGEVLPTNLRADELIKEK